MDTTGRRFKSFRIEITIAINIAIDIAIATSAAGWACLSHAGAVGIKKFAQRIVHFSERRLL